MKNKKQFESQLSQFFIALAKGLKEVEKFHTENPNSDKRIHVLPIVPEEWCEAEKDTD